jgi:hypothetical protein
MHHPCCPPAAPLVRMAGLPTNRIPSQDIFSLFSERCAVSPAGRGGGERRPMIHVVGPSGSTARLLATTPASNSCRQLSHRARGWHLPRAPARARTYTRNCGIFSPAANPARTCPDRIPVIREERRDWSGVKGRPARKVLDSGMACSSGKCAPRDWMSSLWLRSRVRICVHIATFRRT